MPMINNNKRFTTTTCFYLFLHIYSVNRRSPKVGLGAAGQEWSFGIRKSNLTLVVFSYLSNERFSSFVTKSLSLSGYKFPRQIQKCKILFSTEMTRSRTYSSSRRSVDLWFGWLLLEQSRSHGDTLRLRGGLTPTQNKPYFWSTETTI